jgi:hypothetical protein
MKTSIAAPGLMAALRRRIKQFYDRLNRHEFEKCWEMLDPQIRADSQAITVYQYIACLERFLAWCEAVTIRTIEPVRLNINEPNRLYNDRDFAIVQMLWEDHRGQEHVFKERWVRDRRGWWYTRSTGLVVPETFPTTS